MDWRWMVTVAVLTTMPVNAAPLNPKKSRTAASLSAFEFRDVTAGVAMSSDRLARCGSGKIVVCSDVEKVAGLPATTQMTFYNSRLSSVSIIPDDPIYYYGILKAFAQKYGPPCKTSVEKWKNAAGAVLNNPLSTWCFATGTLTAKPMGGSIDTPDIEYTDENQAPEGKAKVDF